MTPTPPTEDRDWKERFDERFTDNPSLEVGWDDVKDFISQEIATAEARGYERGRNDAIISPLGKPQPL